jgi:acetoin utilization deacetylase AcuC-like enzyme
MKIISDERCLNYAAPGHPERPARVAKTLEKLRNQTQLAISWGKPHLVPAEAVLRAHTSEHVARLEEPGDFDADTPFFSGIGEHARASVGAGLAALQAARAGEMVFSLMRPPGHHATRNRSMGFCYLNNIAIMALEALASGAKRVAIYDFDVHHGNGTEAILLNKPGAAFFSIHQFPCYPGTGAKNVGDNCFNYPVAPRTPRAEYRQILQSAFQALKKFKPDLVGVSAGFDAYARDPLAQETLEAEDYHWLGKQFRELGVPVVSLLEGGYSSDLPELIFAYLQGLEGQKLST